MILLYVSYVYHMISGMIKVVVSAFEIYVADVISRQHIRDKNYWQDKGEYTFNFIRLAMACNETISVSVCESLTHLPMHCTPWFILVPVIWS